MTLSWKHRSTVPPGAECGITISGKLTFFLSSYLFHFFHFFHFFFSFFFFFLHFFSSSFSKEMSNSEMRGYVVASMQRDLDTMKSKGWISDSSYNVILAELSKAIPIRHHSPIQSLIHSCPFPCVDWRIRFPSFVSFTSSGSSTGAWSQCWGKQIWCLEHWTGGCAGQD